MGEGNELTISLLAAFPFKMPLAALLPADLQAHLISNCQIKMF